jgi:hypothetical protein
VGPVDWSWLCDLRGFVVADWDRFRVLDGFAGHGRLAINLKPTATGGGLDHDPDGLCSCINQHAFLSI